jgi:hypothetical protein
MLGLNYLIIPHLQRRKHSSVTPSSCLAEHYMGRNCDNPIIDSNSSIWCYSRYSARTARSIRRLLCRLFGGISFGTPALLCVLAGHFRQEIGCGVIVVGIQMHPLDFDGPPDAVPEGIDETIKTLAESLGSLFGILYVLQTLSLMATARCPPNMPVTKTVLIRNIALFA